MAENPAHTGYHSITPYLIIDGAANATAFYTKAFAASSQICLTMPDGKIGYAEIKIGDSIISLSDAFPEMGVLSPRSLNGSAVWLHLYVQDVDAVVNTALSLGAELIRPIQDQFFGDRTALIKDPFGHTWNIATRIETVSTEEKIKRFDAMMKQ